MKCYNNYSKPVTYGEQNKGKSLTRPDQALSIAEIYHRFALGKPVTAGSRSDIYFDEQADGSIDYDAALIDRRTMDFVDQAEMFDARKAEYDALKRKFADEQKIAADAARQKEIDDAVAKKMDEISKSQNQQNVNTINSVAS